MKNIIYLCCLLLLWSCEEAATSEQTASDEAARLETPSQENASKSSHTANQPKLIVETAYATSTAPNSQLAYLFDDNPATFWQTQTGSGPDEGIHLEFKKDHLNEVSSIKVEGVEGENLAQPRLVLLYLNGQSQSIISGKVGEKIEINSPLKSLRLRLFNTEQDLVKEIEKPYAAVNLHQFPASAAVALHSLTFYGKEEDAYQVVLPKIVPGKVTATSTLEPAVAYSVDYLFDGQLHSAWVEGAEGLALGEGFLFEFEQPVVIDRLQIWNGYQRSPHHFETNSSVKNFSFGLADFPKSYTIRNTKDGQMVRLSSKILSKEFALRLTGAYQGSKYSDVAISEVVFYDDQDRAMVIQTQIAENMQKQYQEKAKNTPLASILNRRVYNTFTYKYDNLVAERSLILHDDGTFVYYSKDLNTTKETVEEIDAHAHGNWVILEKSPERVKIRIFGSLAAYNPIELQGTTQTIEDKMGLFKEVLTIMPGQIEGTDVIQQLFWEENNF